MLNVALVFRRTLRRLLAVIKRLSVRGGILILGIVLVIFPLRFDHSVGLDRVLFSIVSFLKESPKGSSGVAIIEISPAEIEGWLNDINTAGKLGVLLSNILHSSDATVGVILQRPLDARVGEVDTILNDIIDEKLPQNKAIANARLLVQRKNFMLEFLQNDRVILGVTGGFIAGQKPISVQPSDLDELPNNIRYWLWPLAKTAYASKDTTNRYLPQFARPAIDHYPINQFREQEYLLVHEWQGAETNSEVYGDFLLYYLNAALKGTSSAGNTLYWESKIGAKVGTEEYVRTSPSGVFVPLNWASKRLAPRIDRMDLEEGLARGAFPRHVFIAASNDAHAERVAESVYSVLEENTLYEPWWASIVDKILLLSICLYLIYVVPRLRASTGIIISLFLASVIIFVQVLAQSSVGLLLVFGTHLCWLFICHLFMLLWIHRKKEWKQLLDRAETADIKLAENYIEMGRLNEALSALDSCPTSDHLLKTLYDVGGAYATQNQYHSAIQTFKRITELRKGYRDTEQKIGTLKSMLTASETVHQNAEELEATLIVPSDGMPEILGRYEIKRELGRGAMGTVYLGHDPKIARNVAVKTLSYQQFQAKELSDLKARFFREAEAAGRLNHPNIVSVYDVGDEAGLAYIAMDYVEGKALSSFIDTECLLPVFEVYRVIADVAQALEYAHSNQIIHRDIKPGNIMYNPAPYQTKVMDFGIARLVDDSRTATGEVLGSPLYMAPEQLKGQKVNVSADIFSLGVTFYQLLSGVLPFEGENLANLTYEIIHGKHKSVRRVRKDLPSSAARIVNQALQKDPRDRYESAAEMARAIKKAIKRDFANEARQVGYLY